MRLGRTLCVRKRRLDHSRPAAKSKHALNAASAMRKYGRVTIVGIQNTMVYRVNFLFRGLLGLVPLLATIYLWEAVYAGRAGDPTLAGYTLADMISYYLVVMVVDSLTAVTDDDWQIAADIRDGRIGHLLLKPIDYLGYRLCLFTAGRLVYCSVAALPIAAFLLWQRDQLVWPADPVVWMAFGASLLLTGLLQFLISYATALLAFWLLEISTFVFILFAFENLAGGHLFPLDILPPAVASALHWTPFPYQLFFPVSVFLGRVSGPELWEGLAIQAAWVVLMWMIARAVWRRGIRHYVAVGG